MTIGPKCIVFTFAKGDMIAVAPDYTAGKKFVFDKCVAAGIPVRMISERHGFFEVTRGTIKSRENGPDHITIEWVDDLPVPLRQRIWAKVQSFARFIWEL